MYRLQLCCWEEQTEDDLYIAGCVLGSRLKEDFNLAIMTDWCMRVENEKSKWYFSFLRMPLEMFDKLPNTVGSNRHKMDTHYMKLEPATRPESCYNCTTYSIYRQMPNPAAIQLWIHSTKDFSSDVKPVTTSAMIVFWLVALHWHGLYHDCPDLGPPRLSLVRIWCFTTMASNGVLWRPSSGQH